ncbi:MAG TPA: HAMP domain-containing sensor histidine kinase [Verrucomicrobiae bacterium]
MSRPIYIWVIFAAAFAILLSAMGWVSATALRLERAQLEAQQKAAFEENIRLALWRMDSALSPLIVQESSRPYFTYNSFYAAERAYNRMFSELRPGEILVPSPLLAQTSTNVLLHFQFGPDGVLSSPQVPLGNKKELAENRYLTPAQIQTASARMAQLRQLVSPNALFAACATTLPREIGLTNNLLAGNTVYYNSQAAPPSQQVEQRKDLSQMQRNVAELQARSQSYQQAVNWGGQNGDNVLTRANVAEGMVKPIWFGDALVLARRVSVDGQSYIQGCWLDWTNIRSSLIASVKDLLPQAKLQPMKSDLPDPQARMLAALPVQLAPGPLALPVTPGFSPIRLALGLAWGCVILAAFAVAALLYGAVSLSERRGAFVSAVTHELRTPLTTFKMYSEMLAANMVPDESKRRHYLNTLCSEANRLSHLVENVLAYARLERGSARSRVERLTMGDLIERVKPRLLERATQVGLALVEDIDENVLQSYVHVDVAAVEQILFNLVDNACKYAAPSAAEKILHLEALSGGKYAMLRVRDHGQGISAEGVRRLFRPFSKSAHEAAHTAPGVGLGLALCRRLSRSMGGDLRFDASIKTGACFTLQLPLSVSNGPVPDSASLG